MNITFTLNGKKISRQIEADTLLIDLVRDLGCYSVKRGCETSNCGLCTVFMDDQPILSCSILAARVDGHKIDTLEGLQEEAAEFGAFIANQGAEQCGFCNPGMIMNAIALFREIPDPTEEEIKEYKPILNTDIDKQIYGPGHNSFVKDENGNDIMIYHARQYNEIIGDPLYDHNRHAYRMKIIWDIEGNPVFDYENNF